MALAGAEPARGIRDGAASGCSRNSQAAAPRMRKGGRQLARGQRREREIRRPFTSSSGGSAEGRAQHRAVMPAQQARPEGCRASSSSVGPSHTQAGTEAVAKVGHAEEGGGGAPAKADALLEVRLALAHVRVQERAAAPELRER